MIAVLLPYLRALSPFWTSLSLAMTLFIWVVMKKQGRAHTAAVCFTVLWLCLVYSSTVLSRVPSASPHWALKPFWSYGQWIQGNQVFLTYILLNILMLLPVGLSLSCLWTDRKRVLLFGLFFSCLIEVSQLITGRGLFEIDDIFHNTLGVALVIRMHAGIRRLLNRFHLR